MGLLQMELSEETEASLLDKLKSMQGSREGENQRRTPQRIAEIIKKRYRTFVSVRVENPECSALSLAGSLQDG